MQLSRAVTVDVTSQSLLAYLRIMAFIRLGGPAKEGIVKPITPEAIKQGDLLSDMHFTQVELGGLSADVWCRSGDSGTKALCDGPCFIAVPTFVALVSSENCRSSSGARQT